MSGPQQEPDEPESVKPVDPAALRVSDADRHRVAEILREAAGDGRIDLEELDQRLEAAYAAKTYAELTPLTIDLPATVSEQGRHHLAVPPMPLGAAPVENGPERGRSVAIMSGVVRRGVWVVPQHYTVLCVMGGADLDLRQARFAAPEVTITVHALMGGADITLNEQTRVIVDGIGVMGAFDGPRSPDRELPPGAPVVRIDGFAIMGAVSVRRRPMPGAEDKPGWRRRH